MWLDADHGRHEAARAQVGRCREILDAGEGLRATRRAVAALGEALEILQRHGAGAIWRDRVAASR